MTKRTSKTSRAKAKIKTTSTYFWPLSASSSLSAPARIRLALNGSANDAGVVQQPRKLETLDDLLAQAEHYANYCMRGTGRVTPVLFLAGPDGPLMFVPESLADTDAKDEFAVQAQLMCIAHGATACVMALEAWATFAKPGEKFDVTEAPSEAFDRREFVILMGETRDKHKQKYLPIIRSGNGKFFGFGEAEDPGVDEVKGRFAQLLPPRVPDEAMREIAKAMLKVKGVKTAMPGTTPRLPRSRR